MAFSYVMSNGIKFLREKPQVAKMRLSFMQTYLVVEKSYLLLRFH